MNECCDESKQDLTDWIKCGFKFCPWCGRELDKSQKIKIMSKRIEEVINCLSLESKSNTPDFIMAEFMMSCFDALNTAINKREEWYGSIPAGARSMIYQRLRSIGEKA